MAQQPNMNQMLQQVKQMQAEMIDVQEKLKDEVVEASAGGGMVNVKVTGDLRVLSVEIDPQAVDPADTEILQDMVTAAVNEGIRAAQQLTEQRMGSIAGGMQGLGLPGL